MSIFQTTKPLIEGNPNLYIPQINAYRAAISHYKEFQDSSHRESLIIMPTGSGKTGVMAMLPFGLSKGRVLIITPGKIVRKTVFEEFDSITNPENTFWYKRKVILDRSKFPKSYLYQGFNSKDEEAKQQTLKKLNLADIVITNIHKIVGSSEEVNLKDLVSHDFFDMIIIDEAHHVAADMWQKTLDYFKDSKVIKLTATPFRSDNLKISTHEYDPIFEYTLAEAIEDGLLKNVVKAEGIPGELSFHDSKSGKDYTLEEAKRILGNDWVNRTIAMDEVCSKQVINHTKEILELKRNSYPYHQVLAVTCNDEHAQLVTKWFQDCGLSCTYVSSRLSPEQIEVRLSDFANGQYDVMVSIQMLGEGYDNPNISVISIFRPFKTLAPYAQAIGRGLRKIYGQEQHEVNNFCNVVYHQELGLEPLWNYYKTQEEYGQFLKKQAKDITEQLAFTFDELGFIEKEPVPGRTPISDHDPNPILVNIGSVSSYSVKGLGKEDSFTHNGYQEYINATHKLVAEAQQITQQKIDEIKNMQVMGLLEEDQAALLINQLESKSQIEHDNTFDEYQKLLLAETMRKDFTRWMHSKLDEFFKTSVLEKEGFELFKRENTIDNVPINNIGYIVKNFKQGLYRTTRKHFTSYLPEDFAVAKKRFLEKLAFYLNQYGEK
ncbi:MULTISPECIES: DEAD/DEAH box helicase [unclassified Bacillus (in: firmicutes)]|uniref:DEAD/DEAH box helicase n=1 Tax=unclassified Bacillus (in: firmicutes) TaxID=185979 RepID=UPI0008E0CC5C|nr:MULTISPECIES: DEAD/DEAH box helicase family protein [unclassified Bacillus (in: firmicutes)]SFI03181.1 Superfamily II DNA or RNA helicase [Bacillus sp. 71mf]SFS81209.1 Superfamily II DNA or RNA helicase [Bacillus sp. 103mf]